MEKGQQSSELLEFGDRYEETSGGKLYIHVPDVEDIRSDLIHAGFSVERDVVKSKISKESKLVHEYSDDCRFWIARKNRLIKKAFLIHIHGSNSSCRSSHFYIEIIINH